LGYVDPDQKQQNFLATIKDHFKDINNEIFSFYFNGHIDQAIFGGPHHYFADEKLTYFNNVASGLPADKGEESSLAENSNNIW
jgi:hypothetical protein